MVLSCLVVAESGVGGVGESGGVSVGGGVGSPVAGVDGGGDVVDLGLVGALEGLGHVDALGDVPGVGVEVGHGVPVDQLGVGLGLTLAKNADALVGGVGVVDARVAGESGGVGSVAEGAPVAVQASVVHAGGVGVVGVGVGLSLTLAKDADAVVHVVVVAGVAGQAGVGSVAGGVGHGGPVAVQAGVVHAGAVGVESIRVSLSLPLAENADALVGGVGVVDARVSGEAGGVGGVAQGVPVAVQAGVVHAGGVGVVGVGVGLGLGSRAGNGKSNLD